jgi:hypothetical protein
MNPGVMRGATPDGVMKKSKKPLFAMVYPNK